MTGSAPFVRFAVRELPAPEAWPVWLGRVRATRGFWLLERALPAPRLGSLAFAGAGPAATLVAHGRRLAVRAGRPRRPGDVPVPAPDALGPDAFAALRAWLPRAPAAPAPLPFVGGAVGWLGYELGAQLERVPLAPRGDLALPDLHVHLVDRLVAHDPVHGRWWAAALGAGADAASASAHAARAADALAARVAAGDPDPFEAGPAAPLAAAPARGPGPEPVRLTDPRTGLALGAFFDEAGYGKAVERLREGIAAGAFYQANLTHRLAVDGAADPWRIYTEARRIGPAPYAAFLDAGDVAVVCASPERFLHVAPDGTLESRPIKGTRPRGATPEEDAALRAALAASAKERAENVMIVDLVRNDLGRVAATGSVEVPELYALEPHAAVWQMVSTVRARLRPGLDVVDALRATFPPGSMTGAPKIAAMAALARLEPVRRGIYSGALGWLDVRGGADLAVVIRTLLCRRGRAWLHVGGGIVLDSEPAAEWAETLAKARTLLDALAAAGAPALG